MRLDQARVLHLQKMHASALALLSSVLDDSVAGGDDVLHRRALGLAGTIEAATNDLVRAEQDLRASLHGSDSWPGATRATSDLGVVLLRAGKREEGVDLLLRARLRFLDENDPDGAAVVERNLARALVTPPYPAPHL